MRIAFVSDIHGNLPALEAVVADLRARGIDRVIDCGDLLSGPLWPAETAERLIALGWPTICGNHERWLLACAQKPGGASDQHAYERTTPAQRDWLAALPATLRPAPGVFVCHGTPARDTEYLLETVGRAGSRLATVDEIAARLAGSDAAEASVELVVCGHSHLPRVCALPDARLVVNPGSVGLPAYDDDWVAPHVHETGSPHARYALCERGAGGAWTVAQVCVAYDWMAASRRAAQQGAPDWARWLASGRA